MSGQCPTCGPTTVEQHPRQPAVTRCGNCKEWLTHPSAPVPSEVAGVVRGWRTYPDGSMSPIERWVKHADGDWVSLDSNRRTSGDILMDFDAGVNAGGADDSPDEAKGLTTPAPASDCLTCGCEWSRHNGWGCGECPCEETPRGLPSTEWAVGACVCNDDGYRHRPGCPVVRGVDRMTGHAQALVDEWEAVQTDAAREAAARAEERERIARKSERLRRENPMNGDGANHMLDQVQRLIDAPEAIADERRTIHAERAEAYERLEAENAARIAREGR